ncbi:hypothetical protein K461DRAFT_273052, partial [Myriangium duriaei CBS 260.36]
MATAAVFRGALRRAAQPQIFRPAAVHRSPLYRRCFSSSPAAFAKKYTQDHEWIEVASDGKTATIGISQYAAAALGDVVYVELPEVDLEFSAGDSIGAVESVKSASDILAPVAGTVVEANASLEDNAKNINESPEDQAWLAKITLADPSEVDALMDADAYKAFTEEVEK